MWLFTLAMAAASVYQGYLTRRSVEAGEVSAKDSAAGMERVLRAVEKLADSSRNSADAASRSAKAAEESLVALKDANAASAEFARHSLRLTERFAIASQRALLSLENVDKLPVDSTPPSEIAITLMNRGHGPARDIWGVVYWGIKQPPAVRVIEYPSEPHTATTLQPLKTFQFMVKTNLLAAMGFEKVSTWTRPLYVDGTFRYEDDLAGIDYLRFCLKLQPDGTWRDCTPAGGAHAGSVERVGKAGTPATPSPSNP